MPRSRLICFGFLLFLCSSLAAQQLATTTSQMTTPVRDSQAMKVIASTVAAFGGTFPTDSLAIGTSSVINGTSEENGTISVKTRSTDQFAFEIQAPSTQAKTIYSRLDFKESAKPVANNPIEWALSEQMPIFPLPLIEEALRNQDFSLTFLGQEELEGRTTDHIRLINTLKSYPNLAGLSEFTTKDLWIDESSGLVYKIEYRRKAGRGASPQTLISLIFQSYDVFSGTAYPRQIMCSLNGSLWQTVTIERVSFNVGLTDADFSEL